MSLYTLTIDGLDEPLFVRELSGREAIGALYEIEVSFAMRADAEPLYARFEELLGAPALLTMGDTATTSEEEAGARKLEAIVGGLSYARGGYHVTLVPALAPLQLCGSERVRVAVSSATIAKELVGAFEVPIEERLDGAPPAQAQWLCRAASDLDWMSEALASQGVQWWLEHDGEGAASVVLGDHAGAYQDITGEPKFRYGHHIEAGLLGAANGAATLYGATLREELTVDAVKFATVDVDNPAAELVCEAGEEGRGHEVYAFGEPYTDSDAGKALAQKRLSQWQRDATVLEGKSGCRRLEVGRCFELEQAPNSAMNGRWLIVTLQWSGWQPLPHDTEDVGGGRPVFEAQLRAVPAERGYAPAPRAHQKHSSANHVSHGVLRATISGSSGSEIEPDALGRVTTHYMLDRDSKADETASTGARVLQPAMGGGLLLPRVGWEALVAFEGGRHDKPIVLGRLDHGAAPTAEALPDKRVRSAMGSPTSPGGGAGNTLQLDDSAGSEGFNLSTAGNYNERSENNKASHIKGSETLTIGGDQTTTTGAMSVGIKASQSLSVSGARDVSAADGIVIQCSSESVSVGGARSFTVGGDYHTGVGGSLSRAVGGIKSITAVAAENRMVSGASAVTVGGSFLQSGATASVTVGGASAVTAGGPISMACAKYALGASLLNDGFGALSMTAGAATAITAGAAMSLTLGACKLSAPTIVVKAKGSLTLTGGGATISMTPASISFSGAFKASDPDVSGGGMVKHG